MERVALYAYVTPYLGVDTKTRDGSAERRRGLYRVLELSAPYALVQSGIGASALPHALMSTFLEPFPGMRVIDVGAGLGTLKGYLGPSEYTALEPNPRYVDTMKLAPEHADTVVISGTTAALASADGPFDRAVMVGVLHHLDDDAGRQAIRDIARVLTPEGRLITVDPCFHEGQHPVAKMLARLDRGANVRSVAAVGSLAGDAFVRTHIDVTTNLLRVPYSHVWMTCTGPRVD